MDNNLQQRTKAIIDRAVGCIMGAFIGDALGLGVHWYYDLNEMRRDYGPWITGYTKPKSGRYHEGMQAGELSQTGIIMKILLHSIAENKGYFEKDFCHRLDEQLLPKLDGTAFHGPGGYTNHSFRQLWQARIRDKKPWGQTGGGNADTSEAAERVSIIAARYALDPYNIAKHANSCCQLTQTDSLVAQQSVAFACVLAALIRGEPFDETLSDKLADLVKTGEIPFVAPSSIAHEEHNSSRPS